MTAPERAAGAPTGDPPPYRQEYVDRDGDRLGVHVYPPPVAASGAAPVVFWPAMGVPAGYYRRFALQLRDAGLHVAVADLRGTGSSTPRPGRGSRYGYADLVDDVDAVLAALRPHLGGDAPVLVGHSLGGQVATLHCALRGRAAGLVLVAVGMPYWRVYPPGGRGRTVLPYTQWINLVSAALGFWPGWGFGGRQARGVVRDWAYTARHGRFPLLHGADPAPALAAMTTPVLAVSMAGDELTPPPTADHFCAGLAAAPVERVHYTAAEAGAALDHFRWVRAAGPLAQRIAAFAAGRTR